MPLAERIRLIDALLPQTQCGQCGHPGCAPYAEAIAQGEAINHCVPGGQATIDALAELTGQASCALDPAYGVAPTQRLVAYIREDECIGCTKCIQACPVDAIVGAGKRMHTVLKDECTGCDLCVAPCPVDCIDMVPGPDVPMTWHGLRSDDPAALAAHQKASVARQRFQAQQQRQRRQQRKPALAPSVSATDTSALMIAAALARSQLKKAERQRDALLARNADASVLEAQITELRRQAEAAQAALDAAQHPTPGSKRVRTTGDIR